MVTQVLLQVLADGCVAPLYVLLQGHAYLHTPHTIKHVACCATLPYSTMQRYLGTPPVVHTCAD